MSPITSAGPCPGRLEIVMSPKRLTLTPKKLEANQANARLPHGAVTRGLGPRDHGGPGKRDILREKCANRGTNPPSPSELAKRINIYAVEMA